MLGFIEVDYSYIVNHFMHYGKGILSLNKSVGIVVASGQHGSRNTSRYTAVPNSVISPVIVNMGKAIVSFCFSFWANRGPARRRIGNH